MSECVSVVWLMKEGTTQMVIALTKGKELDTATCGLAGWLTAMTVLHSSPPPKAPFLCRDRRSEGRGVCEEEPGELAEVQRSPAAP
jgi:hypothetical protein